MEPTYWIIIAAALVIVATTAILLYWNRKPKPPVIDTTAFVAVFDDVIVKDISFARNKIAVVLDDIRKFDATKLKELGAEGISIVGDKVKFYVKGSNEDNQAFYEAFAKALEGARR